MFQMNDKLKYTYLRALMDKGMDNVEVTAIIKTEETLHYQLQSLSTKEKVIYPQGFVVNSYQKAE